MDWKLYKSQVVLDNQRVMISILNNAIPSLGGIDSTWSYDKYNVFGLTSPTQVYYDLFNELRGFVYDYIKPKQLWMQAWVNYHMPDQVLQWHNHEWPIHGYISIRPHKTKTVFEGYEIDNEVGNVYIGPGNRYHRVEVLEDYDTPRITLGFDLLTDPTQCSSNIGLIPFPK
tara:strand:- start:967 stop:1479 length:513 start_codon:yes stop_codon:yes gene_type:complete